MKNLSRTWVEISRKNLLHNLKEFKKIVENKTIACVIKSNAYGHGLEEVVEILKKEKNIWFAVDSLSEAIRIRKKEKKIRILIIGYIPLNQLEIAIKNNFSFIIYNREILEKIIALKLKKPAMVYLKIETGLNRQGIVGKKLEELLKIIKKNPERIILEGVSTHFANIEDTLKSDFAIKQLSNFEKEIELIKKRGFEIPFKHCAATAAIIRYSQTHFNLVRLGIGLYGLWPSRDIRIISDNKLNLKPVLSWKTIIAQIKEIVKGESVGYGRIWVAPRKSKIAVLPIGYYDGFDRKLGNSARVLIKGNYCPVTGRVAMNMIMADVTEVKGLKLEDEVVIIGKQGSKEITVEEIAEKIGTINYEVVTRINPLIPRIIVK